LREAKDPENEIVTPETEPKLSRLEAFGLIAVLALLMVLLWVVINMSPSLL
jgi:hypothetical protein